MPEIEKYLLYNLQELTRFSKSKIERINISDIKQKNEKFEYIEITVPTMRLDSIISELIRVSRNKATEIIQQERVFINFMVENKLSKEIKIGDTLSVRGKGRFKLMDEVNITKNGKIRVKVQKYA